MKKRIFIFCLLFLLSGCTRGEMVEEVKVVEEAEETPKETIQVEIKGEVEKPGVYEMQENDRVITLIKKAGGLKKEANTDTINLSKKVTDEMVVIIYTNAEVEAAKKEQIRYEKVEIPCTCPDHTNDACIEQKEEENPATKKVNINTASLEELMTLSGIGEAKAKKIIEYREKTPFLSIYDITNVSGIGEAYFVKIKDSITV